MWKLRSFTLLLLVVEILNVLIVNFQYDTIQVISEVFNRLKSNISENCENLHMILAAFFYNRLINHGITNEIGEFVCDFMMNVKETRQTDLSVDILIGK